MRNRTKLLLLCAAVSALLLLLMAGRPRQVVQVPTPPDAGMMVEAGVEMHEGFYNDETTYGCRPEYIENEKYVQPDYYGVQVENVTETTFDFTLLIYEGEGEKQSRRITGGTAGFVEDGMKAVSGDLVFTFPNEWNSLPTVVDFRIDGYEPLKDVLFVNNDIPGYQFS